MVYFKTLYHVLNHSITVHVSVKSIEQDQSHPTFVKNSHMLVRHLCQIQSYVGWLVFSTQRWT